MSLSKQNIKYKLTFAPDYDIASSKSLNVSLWLSWALNQDPAGVGLKPFSPSLWDVILFFIN